MPNAMDLGHESRVKGLPDLVSHSLDFVPFVPNENSQKRIIGLGISVAVEMNF